ncbi:MAG: glutaredoxin family protein [Methanomicrobiales archaeon]
MEWTRVEGEDRGKVLLYTLSTCNWCRRTKELLKELNVGYSHLNVDLLPEDEMEAMIQDVTRWNPQGSFPTLVIDDETVIAGFREERIREVFG